MESRESKNEEIHSSVPVLFGIVPVHHKYIDRELREANMKINRKFFYWQEFKILQQEYGLHFVDDEFKGVLKPGKHLFFDPQ
ncbi:MAG: hypothetical protein ACRCUY_14020, partial [Thermoguttaceae bacterium]